MNQKTASKDDKPPVDWEAIERDYRAGVMTMRQIAQGRGITHAAIHKRAMRDCWVRAKLGRSEPIPIGDMPEARADQRGFLYVIYMDDSAGQRYFKIGFASTFTARFGAHQCASPFPLHVACAYFVGDMRSEERFLHDILSEKRIRGEWFKLSNDDLTMISERALLVNGSCLEEIA